MATAWKDKWSREDLSYLGAAMSVIWLIATQDRVQEALGSAGVDPTALPRLMDRLAEQLQETIPEAETIIVIDRLESYSDRADKHVFRVEAVQGGSSFARVVKIGAPDEVHKELAGWRCCERPANERGRVFMAIQPGKSVQDQSEHYETLLYEDAHQTLRAAEVVSLEQAVLSCCRWGTPSTASLLAVFDQIFAEMADRLYRQSWSEEANEDNCDSWKRRLGPGCEHWLNLGGLAGQCREVVLTEVLGKASTFLELAESLEQILDTPGNVPEMRRGCSHGDLHGRNVLVGLVDGEALWPAVFDYEDMRRDNYLGWDFVKLETELKVRAYQVVFHGDEPQFIDSVNRFEDRLAQESESRNDGSFEDWRDSTEHGSPVERLFAILLGIRRQAKKCLEVIHKLNRTWLHEYYFLLACYGVYAGRFKTYRRRDLIAAYLAAGHAAGRYAWSHTALVVPEKVAISQAKQAIAENNPAARLQATESSLSHHAEFFFARELVRSRRKPMVGAGIQILEDLRHRFRLALDVWQELALAHIELSDLTREQGHIDAAERLLLELDAACPRPHYETLCRWGRVWKDRGDEAFDSDSTSPEMTVCYKKALEYYQRAYAEDEHYYPGINVATLLLLVGREQESKQLASQLVKRLLDIPRDATQETVWVLATAGEAHLLLGQGAEAARLYRQAGLHPECQPHNCESMARQIQRILRVHPCAEMNLVDVFDL